MGLRADPKMEGKQKIGFYDFGQGPGFWGCHVHVLGFSELLVFAASRLFVFCLACRSLRTTFYTRISRLYCWISKKGVVVMAGGVVWRAAARSLRKGTMRFMEQPRVVTALRAAAGVVESETSCYHHRASMWSSVSRSASTARDSAPQDGGLLRVLKSEIQHEKDDYEPPSVSVSSLDLKGIPEPGSKACCRTPDVFS